MRILIADDSELVREGIAEILEDCGWQVCGQVSNGTQALEQTRALRPDILLLDVSMPGPNAFEIATTIKREMPSVKILIVSHHDFTSWPLDARPQAADGFVDKARLGTDLASAITRIVGPA